MSKSILVMDTPKKMPILSNIWGGAIYAGQQEQVHIILLDPIYAHSVTSLTNWMKKNLLAHMVSTPKGGMLA